MDTKEEFDEYWKPYIEAYNTPVDINWMIDTEEELCGEFHVNKDKYEIYCRNWGDNIWSYKFNVYLNGKEFTDLLNKNENKFSILSTIRVGMKKLIDERSPNGLLMNLMDESRGREALYDRYSKEISNVYGYTYQKSIIMDIKVILLYKNIEFTKINQAFTKMTREFI